MRALTLHQPWASLIVDGRKASETRSWCPLLPPNGETIAIHAGNKVAEVECVEFGYDPAQIVRGAVLGYAKVYRVVKVTHDEGSTWRGGIIAPQHVFGVTGEITRGYYDDMGDYSVGRCIWLLEDVERLDKPIRCRGWQGLWHFDPLDATCEPAYLDRGDPDDLIKDPRGRRLL